MQQKDLIKEAVALAWPLIRDSEGFRAKAYICPAGVLTIGYGRTLNVKKGDVAVQEAEENWTKVEAGKIAQDILNSLSGTSLNSNQLAALISFVYNFGITKWNSSTLKRVIKKDPQDVEGVERQFKRWVNGKAKDGTLEVLPGLVIRREKEAKLYVSKEN